MQIWKKKDDYTSKDAILEEAHFYFFYNNVSPAFFIAQIYKGYYKVRRHFCIV